MNQPAQDTHQIGHLRQSTERFTIGLLTTANFTRFAPDHWFGVMDAAQRHDLNLVCFLGEAPNSPQGFFDPIIPVADVGKALGSPGEFRGPAGAIFDLVAPGTIDGLIIWTSTLNWFIGQEEMQLFCQRYDLPLVSAEVAFEGIPSVLIDDYGGMYQAVSHLIEVHGCRRLAFIRGSENHVGMRDRYRAYCAALADHGLAVDPSLITPPTSWDGRVDMKVLLDDRGLRPGVDFDAVVAIGGGQAIGVQTLFEERGIQVPRDVAVVGYDNPRELTISIPPYTMVDPQTFEVGQRAVEQIVLLLRGGHVAEQTTVPARLVVRRSCGCPDHALIAAGSARPDMARVVLSREHATRATLADILAGQHAELLADIAEASGITRQQAADFLDACAASLKASSPDPLLSGLESLLQQTIVAGGEPANWHAALSALRRSLALPQQSRLLAGLEDLWQQARVLIAEMARRAQAYQALQVKRQSLMLREVEAALFNTYDIRELADVLARSLLHLGIPSVYLSLYEPPGPDQQQWSPTEWSRLILACDQSGSMYFDAEGQRFRSRELAPAGMLPQRRYCFVAEPLYFREHNLGFILFEVGPRDGLVYETLREGISNALYGDWLLRERQRAEEALRRQAVELELHQREQRRRAMLERVVRAGKAMTQAADLRTCLLHIRNTVQHELGFDRVGVFLYDAERNVISGSFGTDRAGNLTEEWDIIDTIVPDTAYEMLLTQSEGFLSTDDFEAKYNLPPDNPMAGVKHHAMVGVWANSQPIAILAVDNLLTQRRITEEQLEALRLSAGYAALAIENARLLDQARQAEQKYRAIFDNSLEGIAQIALDGRFLSANPAMARILGYRSPEEFLDTATEFEHQLFVDPERRDELKRLLDQHGAVRDFEFQIRRHDGRLAWVSLNARLMSSPQHSYIEGSWQDITERRQLEAQLLKSQKMEAIGQLAGGIAHDFNNLLVVISGNVDLASASLAPDDPIQPDLREIQNAATRASNLTRQLLTFARRQASAPQPLNLNELLLDIDKLLRRLIREDIVLQSLPASELWLVQADPGQIEQVIINLAVNARDAMPQGGRLTIETGNIVLDQEYARLHLSVAAGPYVLLAVTDTGTGMSAEVQQRAFEPFFTTKEPGQGTGLGLATCYGIIKQHGGSIELYSEVGRGTSVKIYLPRAMGATAAPRAGREIGPIPRGTETILLVEDAAAVRALAARMLRGQGYTVLEAANGIEALELVQRHADVPIELLLTDMIMPKMSGYELAEQLRLRIPDLRVLFMSGYTDNAIIHQGLVGSNIIFIHKPFTLAILANSVRALLDR